RTAEHDEKIRRERVDARKIGQRQVDLANGVAAARKQRFEQVKVFEGDMAEGDRLEHGYIMGRIGVESEHGGAPA
ncbi:MAG TPA: hypothetical protein VFC18_19835, partial [Burkholderiales bacterium]|nr:hypothetical protein [Burkholderiales bacterium]